MSDPRKQGPRPGGGIQEVMVDPFLVCSPMSTNHGQIHPRISEVKLGSRAPQHPRQVINPYLRRQQPTSRPVVNPYLSRFPASRVTGAVGIALTDSGQTQQPKAVLDQLSPCPIPPQQKAHSSEQGAMGLNSRHRVGAVKASKRHGVGKKKSIEKKVNSRKNQLGGFTVLGVAKGFNPNHHCVVCRAAYLGCTKPHRPHHERCHRNKVTRGLIPSSSQQAQSHMDDEKKNPPTIKFSKSPAPGTTAWEKLNAVWGRAAMASLPSNNQQITTAASDKVDHSKSLVQKLVVVEESLGRHLRTVLELRMAAVKNPIAADHDRMKKIVTQCNKSLPAPIALLFDYIGDQTRISHRSKTGKGHTPGTSASFTTAFVESLAQRYKYYAPNSCIFTFPTDPSSHPFEHYHAIEGMSIFSLDWEAMFPGMQLPECMEVGCNGLLRHDRSNFSKNKKLFPVFTSGGIVMWGSFMIYRCQHCQSTFNANDGCFLARLDDHIAAAYPVEPRYALANYRFHLSVDLTDDLRSTILSNGSGDSFSAKLHHSQGNRFRKLVKTYASKAKCSRLEGGVPSDWTIKFSSWNGKYAPSGSQLRSYYLDGEQSPLTSYQFSHCEQYKRELQQVGKNLQFTSAAVDWTFQVLKTYVSLPGSKACFTFKVSDGQMAGIAIVPSTALVQVSHFLIQLVTLRNLKVQVLYTDLWPTGEVFWKNIFGTAMTGCLGMFHAMKRITDTFCKSLDADFFQEAMNDFKKCFYSIDATDLSNLYSALKNGSMSHSGHKYSDAEVQVLEKSKFWNRRYGRFLKKVTHPGGFMQQQLSNFANKWKSSHDSKSRKLFSETTEKAIKEQFKNVMYVADPHNMYKEVKPSQNSKHGLSEWTSLRMESQLEKGHHLMAHYGNTGMGTTLADSLILRGITETNTKVRFKSRIKDALLPSHLEHIPLFLDESELVYVNQQLQKASLSPVFDDVTPLPPDNGEVFLSEYFFQQMARNAKGPIMIDTKANRCVCPSCEGFDFPITKRNSMEAGTASPAVVNGDEVELTTRAAITDTTDTTTTGTNAMVTTATGATATSTTTRNGRPVAQKVRNKVHPVPAQLKQKQGVHQHNLGEIHDANEKMTVPPPFFMATNLPNTILHHQNLPTPCFPYYPFYCSMQYTWHAQGGPTIGQSQANHSFGCPGQHKRRTVASPFMGLYHG